MPLKNAEYLLAITHTKDLFSEKPIKLTRDKLSKLQNMDKGISNRIKQFIVSDKIGNPSKSDINTKDFSDLRDFINSDRDLVLEKQIAGIQDDEIRDLFALKSTEAVNHLKEILPVNTSETLFGIEERDPSDFEKSKFIRQVRVLHDPSHVLDLVDSGEITGTEVDALATFYPEYLSEVQKGIVEAIIDLRAKKENVNFGRRKNMVLSTILQVPRITPDLLDSFQASYVDQEEDSDSEPNLNAEALMTDTQRVANK